MITILIDLSWINDGQPWPPKDADEAARLAEHARMRAIYNGLHDSIFPRYAAYLADAAKDAKKPVIILDWAELATTSYLNLLIGEEPEVKAGQKEGENLQERPDEEVFIDCSRYGHGLYEISDNAIIAINPENVYLVVQPGNIRQINAYVVFTTFKREEADADGKKKEHEYVKFTIHSKTPEGNSQIRHLIYEIVKKNTADIQGSEVIQDKKTLSGPKKLADFEQFKGLVVDSEGKQQPKADNVLIVHVQNQLTSERYYGRSDYKPSVMSLIEGLELAFAQRDEVLSKFTNPTPVVPESATVWDHRTEEWIYKPGMPIITKKEDVPPSLMVWPAELGAVEKSIDQKMDQLLQMLQLSRVLLAGQGQGQAESGTALRIRLIPTLAKVQKYAKAYLKAVPSVINLWSQLHPPKVEKKNIQILMKNGIPDDPLETAQTTALWDSMGAVSLERKLELQGLKPGSDAYNQELARLRDKAPADFEEPEPLDFGNLEGQQNNAPINNDSNNKISANAA